MRRIPCAALFCVAAALAGCAPTGSGTGGPAGGGDNNSTPRVNQGGNYPNPGQPGGGTNTERPGGNNPNGGGGAGSTTGR